MTDTFGIILPMQYGSVIKQIYG